MSQDKQKTDTPENALAEAQTFQQKIEIVRQTKPGQYYGTVLLFGLTGITLILNASVFIVIPFLILTLLLFSIAMEWIDPAAIWAALQSRMASPSSNAVDVPPPGLYYVNIGSLENWQPQSAISLMRALLEVVDKTPIRFKVQTQTDKVVFSIELNSDYLGLNTLTGIVNNIYPHASISDKRWIEFPTAETFEQALILFHRSENHEFYESLLKASDIRQFDPLAHVIQTMINVRENELLSYMITAHHVMHFSDDEIHHLTSQTMAEAGVEPAMHLYPRSFAEGVGATLGRIAVAHTRRVARYTPSEEQRHLAKLSQSLYITSISMDFQTPDRERLNAFRSCIAAMSHFSDPKHPILVPGKGHTMTLHINNLERMLTPQSIVRQWLDQGEKGQQKADMHAFYLTADELAALWHLPHTGFEFLQDSHRELRVPEAVKKLTTGTEIGVNRYAGQETIVRIPEQGRTNHTAIIGRTGTGKSSILHRMIHDDIAAGRGLCLIDPEGDLVSDVLQHSIPAKREKDVVVLDISRSVDGTFYPPPFNFLASVADDNYETSVRRLMTVFSLLFDDVDDRRMGDTLHTALLALEGEDYPTLLDIRRQFIDEDYRLHLRDAVGDFVVKGAIEEFDKKSAKQKQAEAWPIYWRLRTFYNNRHLRSMTCHPDRLDMYRLVAANSIILISLGDVDDILPERERYVLGAALIAQIESAAQRGAVQQVPFMLYIDEAQEFIRTPLPRMLSRMRKRGLGLVLSNQYLGQLFRETKDAIEGTVGTMIAFEIGEDDAGELKTYFNGFERDELTRLGQYNAAVSMRVGSRRQPAFNIETLPPPGMGTSNPKREAHLRRLSVERLGLKPYSEVNAWLETRYAGVDFTRDTQPPEGFQDEFME